MDILIDKTIKSYDYFSRYTQFPYYFNTLDQKHIYGTTSQLKQDISYSLHKVKRNETFDTIALDYYNNPTFFWIICDYNHIQDPFIELEENTVLKIPVLSDVVFEEI